MRWMIYGADSKTGRELSVVVDADDQKTAADWMYYNDILVSSIAEFTAANAAPPPPPPAPAPQRRPAQAPPALEYHAEDRPPDDRPPLASAPAYQDVLRGARCLHGLAVLAQVIACMLLVIGVGAITFSFFDDAFQRRIARDAELVPNIVYLVGGCVSLGVSLLLLFCASMIGMMSGLVVAVRDIARNSFGGPPPAAAADAALPGSEIGVTDLRRSRRARAARVELLSSDDAPAAAAAATRLLRGE